MQCWWNINTLRYAGQRCVAFFSSFFCVQLLCCLISPLFLIIIIVIIVLSASLFSFPLSHSLTQSSFLFSLSSLLFPVSVHTQRGSVQVQIQRHTVDILSVGYADVVSGQPSEKRERNKYIREPRWIVLKSQDKSPGGSNPIQRPWKKTIGNGWRLTDFRCTVTGGQRLAQFDPSVMCAYRTQPQRRHPQQCVCMCTVHSKNHANMRCDVLHV